MKTQLKKVSLLVLGVLLVIGLGTYFLWPDKNLATGQKLYNKEELHGKTLLQLEDPLYKNIITPASFEKSLKNKEDITVYFYSPLCGHCEKTTPILVPLAKEHGVNLYLFNLLEFKQGAKTYNIEGTPTIIHYQDGKEVDRLVGAESKRNLEKWLKSINNDE
ncbi:thioredoxin-like negative regulator of GroEL [Bacillus pakistanensis]|uniref:Thioredoxin-like negative regulator of GroEL n=1 Tax=Rossellomorea pakistanensis TaxID=992288 RepID=A0ABS2NIK0_9BACI|nr:thioredoxin family protein [Bacillus pakistanensis]MBM7587694.1 thioredoxin-like negative regulator of GroEL [Bacillus pakistanensis]